MHQYLKLFFKSCTYFVTDVNNRYIFSRSKTGSSPKKYMLGKPIKKKKKCISSNIKLKFYNILQKYREMFARYILS